MAPFTQQEYRDWNGQGGIFPLYPHLQIYGQMNVSAGDPALDMALKKLVSDALAPLAQYDREVAKTNQSL